MAVLYTQGIFIPTYDQFITVERQAEQAINPKSNWKQVGPMHNMSIRFPEIAPQFGVTATPFSTDDWSKVAKMASPTTPVMATQLLGGGKSHQLVITGVDDAGRLTGWDPRGESFTNQQKGGIDMKSFVQIKTSKQSI